MKLLDQFVPDVFLDLWEYNLFSVIIDCNKLLYNVLIFVWNLYVCVCVFWKFQSVENGHLQDVFFVR